MKAAFILGLVLPYVRMRAAFILVLVFCYYEVGLKVGCRHMHRYALIWLASRLNQDLARP